MRGLIVSCVAMRWKGRSQVGDRAKARYSGLRGTYRGTSLLAVFSPVQRTYGYFLHAWLS